MLVIYLKKTDYNTKISEIEHEITADHHDKYITIQEFNKLRAQNFSSRLVQANLASKNDIVNLVKKTDFDNKLKHLNKYVTSNKTKHVLVENELNELSEKIKAISAKRLTKDLINGYKILNGAKYFSSRTLKIILDQPKNGLNMLVALLESIRGNVMKHQKKILKI